MARFLPNAKISDVHGQPMQAKGRLVVPMYNPAAALHQPSLKPMLEHDFSRLPELISHSAAASAPVVEEVEEEKPKNKTEPKQLSLF